MQRLKAWVKPWSQFPELKLAELGRGIDRARSLGEVIQALEVATVEIRNGLGSYCRPQGRQNSQTVLGGFRDRDPDTVSIGQFPSENVTIARDVVSTRLRFPGEPSFDPRPLFDFETKEAYEDPEALRLEAPTSRPPKVRIRASKDEQLRLFALWAAGGRLALAAAALVVWRCGLFTVYKSEDVDRMILDARPPNCFERALNKWTRTMGTVISVLGLFLPPGRVLALYADDIRDYYYQFKISRSRAMRNALVGDWRASDLQGIARAGGLQVPQAGHVAACLNTMAMGDLNAVEFGQAAHFTLLARAGALGVGEELCLDRPVPRGYYAGGAIIDDHGGLEMEKAAHVSTRGDRLPVPQSEPPVGAIGPLRFEKANLAYKAAGLESHPGKAVRRCFSDGVLWGGAIDGLKGVVRAPLVRVVPLAVMTMAIAKLGFATVKTLEVLSGSWVSVFLFRRRLMCV